MIWMSSPDPKMAQKSGMVPKIPIGAKYEGLGNPGSYKKKK